MRAALDAVRAKLSESAEAATESNNAAAETGVIGGCSQP
jgi:hypothetical protein